MDILLANANAYDLPTEHRVQVIVHGGTSDFDLWPGPGEDRDLKQHWGESLQEMLTLERKRLLQHKPQFADVIRMQPGRLHCDYLLWACTREPEPGTERSKGLNKEQIKQSFKSVIEFVADRSHESIAINTIGSGPGELLLEDRLVALAEEINRVEEAYFVDKKPFSIETVLICSTDAAALRNAKSRLPHWVKLVGVQEKKTIRKTVSRNSSSNNKKKSSSNKFSQDELSQALQIAKPYDRTQTYLVDNWLVHPKFGLGKVTQVGNDQSIIIRFESGDEKKLIHNR